MQVLSGNAIVGAFSRATFNSIVINAVGGNDTIVLSRIFGPITEPAMINGGLGDDQSLEAPAATSCSPPARTPSPPACRNVTAMLRLDVRETGPTFAVSRIQSFGHLPGTACVA